MRPSGRAGVFTSGAVTAFTGPEIIGTGGANRARGNGYDQRADATRRENQTGGPRRLEQRWRNAATRAGERSGEFLANEVMDSEVIRIQLLNRERVRCCRFGGAARREEREYSSIFERRATPRQRQRFATLRATPGRAAGIVAPQSQNASAMLLRRALPAIRPGVALSFAI